MADTTRTAEADPAMTPLRAATIEINHSLHVDVPRVDKALLAGRIARTVLRKVEPLLTAAVLEQVVSSITAWADEGDRAGMPAHFSADLRWVADKLAAEYREGKR